MYEVELGFTSTASGEPCDFFSRCTLRDYCTLPNKSMKKIPRIFWVAFRSIGGLTSKHHENLRVNPPRK